MRSFAGAADQIGGAVLRHHLRQKPRHETVTLSLSSRQREIFKSAGRTQSSNAGMIAMFSARPAFTKALLALFLLCHFLCPLAARAQSQKPPSVALSVLARDPLPGFRKEDEARYLADQMRQANAPGWSFAADTPSGLPPHNRIEWRFELDPYAGGGIRQFFPIPGVQRLFGARHLITAEAMLYLDDEYQTLMFGQATISGGAQDKELAAFIARMTEGLLGAKGAYRAIDMSGPAAATGH
jgi:hypothetical protein